MIADVLAIQKIIEISQIHKNFVAHLENLVALQCTDAHRLRTIAIQFPCHLDYQSLVTEMCVPLALVVGCMNLCQSIDQKAATVSLRVVDCRPDFHQ